MSPHETRGMGDGVCVCRHLQEEVVARLQQKQPWLLFCWCQAEKWYRSLQTLVRMQRGTWNGDHANMATFGAVAYMPSLRHALRRYYENNAKVIVTVPPERLTIVDYTLPKAAKAVTRYACITHKRTGLLLTSPAPLA